MRSNVSRFALAGASLALILVLVAVPVAAKAPSAELSSRLDGLFSKAVPPEGPGVSVLVARDGEVLLEKGYGLANVELGVGITPDTVFRLGSITKQFTAVAILQLVAEGKLALDDPAAKHLPAETAQLADGVTVRQLLVHTSGIKSYTGLSEKWFPKMRLDLTPAQIVDLVRDEARDFPPGERWLYNNTGYILLGMILEHITGKPYAEVIRERLFAPLGMNRSFYDDTAMLIPRRAAGYEGTENGYRNADYLSMTQPYAAGSLASTVQDLRKWDDALYGERLLPARFRDQLWQEAKLADGRGTHYGLGWGVWDYEGHRIIQHNGGINGFATAGIRVPDARLYVAVLANCGSCPGVDPNALALSATTLALGKPLDARPSVQLPTAVLDEYVGVYEIEGNPEDLRQVTREGDTLFTQRRGSDKRLVKASAKDEWYYPEDTTRLIFVRDAAGKVTGTVMRRSIGTDEQAKKTDRPFAAPRQEITLDPARLAEYPGEYQLAASFSITVTLRDGKLFAQATGQSAFEIFAEAPDRFFLKVVDAVITFSRDAEGRITQLVLQQAGQNLPGKKIR